MSALNIGWFSTGNGPGSLGLLRFVQERLSREGVDARIQFVFSNREAGEAEGSDEYMELVRAYDLPLVTLSSTKFRRARRERFADHREEFDRLVAERLAGFRPDICVLAGYMLIFGAEMSRRHQFLNLHPALPDGPIGTWQQVVWELIKTRARRTGTMVHLATEVVDRGPVVSYCTVPLTGDKFAHHWIALEGQDVSGVKESEGEDYPLFQAIRQRQYAQEPYLLFETLRAVANGKVSLEALSRLPRQRSTGDGGDSWGICLDEEVGRLMEADGLKGGV